MKKSLLSVVFLLAVCGFAFAGTNLQNEFVKKHPHHRHHHHNSHHRPGHHRPGDQR
jgi:hypothetical protein